MNRYSWRADGINLVVSTPAGRLAPGVLELVEAAWPLLLAELLGHPLKCAVSDHKGKPPAATTMALGGAPWCGACRP